MSTNSLIGKISAIFEAEGWNFQSVPEHQVLKANFETPHTKLALHAQAFEEIGAVSIVATASVPVPESHRSAVAEMLMRTNEVLTVGNLEMRWDEGQVLFRTTNIFPDGAIHSKVLVGMVQTALAETDRITPFLSTLIHSDPNHLNVVALLGRTDLLNEPE